MSNRSTSRLRRSVERSAETQQQFITFRLGRAGFLLPIDAVYKAVVFTTESQRCEVVSFEDQQLPLLNVEQHIFNQSAPVRPRSQQIVLIIQDRETIPRMALPIDSPPALCRIALSSLVPLPKTYQLRCVQLMTDQSADQSLCFLLNPDLLLDAAPPMMALAA